MKQKSEQFAKALDNLQNTKRDVGQTVTWLNERYYWPDVLSELRRIMIKVEHEEKAKYRTDTGVWVEQFMTAEPRTEADLAAQGAAGQGATDTAGEAVRRAIAEEAFRKRYGLTRSVRQEAPVEATVSVDATGAGRAEEKGRS